MSNVITLVGLALIITAIAFLAGGWWAVLAAGAVLTWVGYVSSHSAEAPAPAAARATETKP